MFEHGSGSYSILLYLLRVAKNEELIQILQDPKRANERFLKTSTDRAHADESVQARIVEALRKKAERVMDLFKRWAPSLGLSAPYRPPHRPPRRPPCRPPHVCHPPPRS